MHEKDIRNIYVVSFLFQDELLPGYMEELPKKLDAFEKFLGDKKFFAGEEVGCHGY